jgi:putative transcriptional regulator
MPEPRPPSLPLRAGRLLVANPLLPDPNFDRTVVLLIAHGEEGALGLVLNRPSKLEVAEPLPQWSHLAAEPPVLFVGGPVQHSAVICLARLRQVEGPGEKAIRPVTRGIATLDLDSDPAEAAGRVEVVRLFAGYAGWGAGQLEREMEAGAWWVVVARPGDAFSTDPTDLWKAVLRRQRSSLRFAAYFPDDPRLN